MRMVFKTNPDQVQAKAQGTVAAPTKVAKTATQATPEVEVGSDARIEERIRRNDRRIDRDLFVPDVTAFPLAPVKPKTPVSTGVDKTNQKSTKEIVEELAGTLVLQSTIISADPTAIINGELLNRNETIQGFTVVTITAGACEVTKDGVTVRLVMKRDEDDKKNK